MRTLEPSVEPPVEPIQQNEVEKETVVALYEHWLQETGRNGRTRLTPERERKLRARLRSYQPGEIRMAISNVASSEFHRRGPPAYTDLTLICRSDEKLENYRDMQPSSQMNMGQAIPYGTKAATNYPEYWDDDPG